ncbi:hypothetical protein I4Q36_07715 [Tuanshanicoccus lijuaniae]|uniref:hypothetical protein n=1 Tax=Aerococcaceae bacterium zg-1292 TaxID=2774330 RepID=UPI0019352A57|nr:hypothetical protein [Aerococcaceae bacterium zg-1292]QQA36678.1 hypothetical protein I4Q36_07715 [Aerococcaceae bacterium zg-1292]
MTDSVFFDTDCICAFLWSNEESLLEKMYPGKIVIPKEVYNEIDRPTIPHLKARVDKLIAKGSASIVSMDIRSEEYALYRKLTTYSEGNRVIGSGEAASISLAKKYNGVLGSNNLKDIGYYINKYSLKHITTGDILVEAYRKRLITEQEGNAIWTSMLNKKRKIGATSFTEFLEARSK